MTMLDRMRRHKNWLKWSLGLVCLAFVIFYIPDFLRNPTTDQAATDTVAVVGSYEIKSVEFQRTYQAQLQSYQAATGGKMSDRLLKQLGVDQQILQQLVDEYAAFVEAERQNIRVSDEEVRQRILTFPAFQENGAFIGEQRYHQLLSMQNPPLVAADFEKGVRRALTVEKLRAAVAGWVSVTEAEVDQEYRRMNEKVKLALVSFPVDSFRSAVSPSDADVASYFDSHKEEFRIPEKRKIRYLKIDIEAMRGKVVVPQADIERRYNDNFEEYTTPDQLRASHILLTTEGKDPDAVKATAEGILKQAKAGADFAELAKKYSQDQATAAKGGDLDYFERGRMVPEFDAAAFAMEPNQISDLVQTQYGFHIIKVTDKKPGVTHTLEEVRPQLLEELTAERSRDLAAALAERLARQVTKPADMDAAAKTEGLTVEETGFFARDEPILGLGASQELSVKVFEMQPGQISNVMQTSTGYVMATLLAKTDPAIPQLADVKDPVRDAVIRQKAGELAQQKAASLAPKLKDAPDFEKAAKALGLDVQTTDLITRDSPIPSLGVTATVTESAFALPQGGVTEPISTETGTAIVKVIQKQEVSAADLAANRERFREDMLADRQNRFFNAYMAKAKEKIAIQVNREVVQRIVG